MKKYGSLIFVLGALVVSSVAFADIPIVHKDHGSKGTELKKEMDEKCKPGEPRLVKCGALGVGCKVECGVDPANIPAEGQPAALNHKATNRKTAAVKDDSAE